MQPEFQAFPKIARLNRECVITEKIDGINRGYGLQKGEKRFSLFNVARWEAERPACCHVVPVLYRGPFNTAAIDLAVARLRDLGSFAESMFPNPEGIIVWHEAARQLFKVTLDGDEKPKGQVEAEQKAKAA